MADPKTTTKAPRNPFKGRAEALAADLQMREELGDTTMKVDTLVRDAEHVYRLTVERVSKARVPK